LPGCCQAKLNCHPGARVFDSRYFSGPPTPSPAPRGQFAPLIGFVGLCLLVAVADGAVTVSSAHGWYLSLTRPPGTPPSWVFGPVWTVLYIMMGTAAWLVWRRVTGTQWRVMRLWGWQLLLNAAWSPAFFGLHSPALGLCVVLALLALIGLTILAFRRIDPIAAALMLPYALWTCYATYLNAGFVLLNPG
jgi:translocator protein